MASNEAGRLLALGEELFRLGNLEKARCCFEAVLKEDPGRVEVLNNLGVVAFSKGEIRSALGYFLRAATLEPLYREALENLQQLLPAVTGLHNPRPSDCQADTNSQFDQPFIPAKLPPAPPEYDHPLERKATIVRDRRQFVVNCCRGRKVLHIGCVGSGDPKAMIEKHTHLHYRLAQVAENLVGVDINREGIHTLIEAGFPACFCMDVEEKPMDREWVRDIDIVVVPEVLEHLSNPGRFLDNLRSLDFSGELLFSVPNAFSYRILAVLVRNHSEMVHPDHHFHFSPTTFRSLLKAHGFIITELIYYYWPSSDVLGRSFEQVLTRWPHLAEGMMVIAKAGHHPQTQEDRC